MTDIRTRKSRAEVDQALHDLPLLLSGKMTDTTGIIAGMWMDMGIVLLTLIHDAFLTKARGGTDEAGISWQSLSPYTIAYKRDFPDLVRKHPGDRPRGLLSSTQDARWRAIFAGSYRSGIAGGQNDRDASSNAATVAWAVLKSEGAKTIFEEYGGRAVDILIHHGNLEDSLKPGSSHPKQIFRIESDGVTVGSSLPYANAHHHGSPAQNLPQRQLWPEPGDNLPQAWVDKLTERLEHWSGVLLERLLA